MKTKSLTKATLLTIFVMSVITAVTLNSCQKEVVKPKNKGVTAATDPTASATQALEEINNILFSSSKNKKVLGQDVNSTDTTGGVIITIDTISKPHTRIYNYGSGCVCGDGKTRSGVVTFAYGDPDIRVVNNVCSLVLQNYTVSSLQITGLTGTVSFTNTGTNSNGNLVITETGGYVANQGSATDTLNVNYQYEWLQGESSSPLSGLQFRITGAAYGSSSTQVTGVDSIVTPLIRNYIMAGCNYYVQGTVYTTFNNSNTVKTIDYGNPGGCSGMMVVTQNGVSSIQHQ